MAWALLLGSGMVAAVQERLPTPRLDPAGDAQRLSDQGASLEIGELQDLEDELEAAGIDSAALQAIAGEDRVIRGPVELQSLLTKVGEATRPSDERSERDIARASQLYLKLCERARAHGKPAESKPAPAPGEPGYPTSGLRPNPPRGLEAPNEVPLTGEKIDADLAALGALPTPKGGQPVLAYSHAVEARDAHAARPADVNPDLWTLSNAVKMEGLEARDVNQFITSGTLPDQVAADGTVKSGEQRLAELESRASHGSWPAENTLAYLTYGRKAALKTQLGGLEAEAKTLASDDPRRQGLEQQIAELKATDAALGKVLLEVKSEATVAREGQHRGLLGQAADLRKAGKEAEATRLERRAADLAEAETRYRKGMNGKGAFDPRGTLSVAAASRLSTGAAKVAEMQRSPAKFSEEVPVELGHGKDADGRRGAGAILEERRALSGAPDREQHQLEGQRERLLGDHQDAGIKAEQQKGVHADPRVIGSRWQKLAQHKKAESGAIQGERDTLGHPPTGAAALDDADLAGRQRDIDDELAVPVANAQAAFHHPAPSQADQLKAAQEELKGAEAQLKAAETREGERREKSVEAGENADPALGGLGVHEEERARANVALKDTGTLEDQAQRDVTHLRGVVAEARARVEALKKPGAQPAPTEVAQRQQASAAGHGVTGAIAASSEPEALRTLQASGDRYAAEVSADLDRAEKTLPPDQLKAKRAEIAERRAQNGRHYARAIRIAQHGSPPGRIDHDAQQNRLVQGQLQLNQATRTVGELNKGEGRTNLAADVVETGCDLAVAGAPVDPKRSNELLQQAEGTVQVELTGEAHRTGLLAVGTASAEALKASNDHLTDLANRDRWDPNAGGALRARAERLLTPTPGPKSERQANAERILGRERPAAQAFDDRTQASQEELDRGGKYNAAQIREIGRSEAGFVQGMIASDVEPSFVHQWVTDKVVDAITGKKSTQDSSYSGTIARTADQKYQRQVDFSDRDTATAKGGAAQLQAMHQRAEAAGEGSAFREAVRVYSDPRVERGSPAYVRALGVLEKYNGDRSADGLDYQVFLREGVKGGAVPSARALNGSSEHLADGAPRDGHSKDYGSTASMSGHVVTAGKNANATMNEFKPLVYGSMGLQAVKLVVEMSVGVGEIRAPKAAHTALKVAKGAEQADHAVKAAKAAQNGSRFARIAKPVAKAAATHVVIAGGTALAHEGADAAFGKNSLTAKKTKDLVNVLPMAHAASVAQGGQKAVTAAARVKNIAKTAGVLGATVAAQHGGAEGARALGADEKTQALAGVGAAAVVIGGVAGVGAAKATKVPGPPRPTGEGAPPEHPVPPTKVSPVDPGTQATPKGPAPLEASGPNTTKLPGPGDGTPPTLRSPGANDVGPTTQRSPTFEPGRGAPVNPKAEGVPPPAPPSDAAPTVKKAVPDGEGPTTLRSPGPTTDAAPTVKKAPDGEGPTTLRSPGATTDAAPTVKKAAPDGEGPTTLRSPGPRSDAAPTVKKAPDGEGPTTLRSPGPTSDAAPTVRNPAPASEAPTVRSPGPPSGATPTVKKAAPEGDGAATKRVPGSDVDLAPITKKSPVYRSPTGRVERPTVPVEEHLPSTARPGPTKKGADADPITRKGLGAERTPPSDEVPTVRPKSDEAKTPKRPTVAPPAGPTTKPGLGSPPPPPSSGVPSTEPAPLTPRTAPARPRPGMQVRDDWRALTPEQRYQALRNAYPASPELKKVSPQQLHAAFGERPLGDSFGEMMKIPGMAEVVKSEPHRANWLHAQWLSYSNHRARNYPGLTVPTPTSVADLESTLQANLPKRVQMGSKDGPKVNLVINDNGRADQAGARLGPISADDHNGAMFELDRVPGRRGLEWGANSVPRIDASPKLYQLDPPPGAQPIRWPEVFVFNVHGGPSGFGGQTNEQAAKMIAEGIMLHKSMAKPGTPPLKYVLLDACHQGDLRPGAPYRTNAAEMEARINAELARRGQPPITVLAAAEGGPTWNNGKVNRPYQPGDLLPDDHAPVTAHYVPANRQPGVPDPNAQRAAERARAGQVDTQRGPGSMPPNTRPMPGAPPRPTAPQTFGPFEKALVAGVGGLVLGGAGGTSYVLLTDDEVDTLGRRPPKMPGPSVPKAQPVTPPLRHAPSARPAQ